jgi:hypothetical protein
MAMNTDNLVTKVIAIVFALALLPIAFSSVTDFATAYPEWATVIGLVSLALIFGVVRTAMKK